MIGLGLDSITMLSTGMWQSLFSTNRTSCSLQLLLNLDHLVQRFIRLFYVMTFKKKALLIGLYHNITMCILEYHYTYVLSS